MAPLMTVFVPSLRVLISSIDAVASSATVSIISKGGRLSGIVAVLSKMLSGETDALFWDKGGNPLFLPKSCWYLSSIFFTFSELSRKAENWGSFLYNSQNSVASLVLSTSAILVSFSASSPHAAFILLEFFDWVPPFLSLAVKWSGLFHLLGLFGFLAPLELILWEKLSQLVGCQLEAGCRLEIPDETNTFLEWEQNPIFCR